MMFKSLVALAILSAASSPVLAQTAPAPDQTAKQQTVKKRVCEMTEENSYSRLGGRKICHMVEVPATPSGGQNGHGRQPAPTPPQGN
jgi:hypothetical protein